MMMMMMNITMMMVMIKSSWLHVFGVSRHFYSYDHIMAVGDAHVFPGFLRPVLTQLFFPKPPTTFLTCFCRGESEKNKPETKFASTGDRTHNHQVMSPIRSPLSHLGGANKK